MLCAILQYMARNPAKNEITRFSRGKSLEKARHSRPSTYTFLLASNADGTTKRFHVSIFGLRCIALFSILLVFGFVVLVFAYVGLLGNYARSKNELVALEELNQSQKKQLFEMDSIVSEVEDKLVYLTAVESRIKELIEEQEKINGKEAASQSQANAAQ